MIEVKKQTDNESLKTDWKLYFNGELLSETKVNIVRSREDSRNYFNIFSKSVDESRKIFNNRISDFPPLEYLSLEIHVKGNEMLNQISISPDYPYDAEGELDIIEFSTNRNVNFEITTVIDPNLNEWIRNFTSSDYVFEFKKILLNNKILEAQVYSGEPNDYRFVIKSKANFADDLIIIEVKRFLSQINRIHEEVLYNLKNNKIKNFVVVQFNFPDVLKIHCEQYLSYFAKFLEDLGLEANSSLKEEAGKVLFSITPTNDTEALDKIREALAVYLNLPSSPIIYDDSFAAMRLQQQIENLQHSQRMAVRELQFNEKLLIAQSETIREKNVTISQLQSINENQSKIIEKISSQSIMMDSAENKEELEKIYDGLEVGYSKWLYEKTGIKANPVKSVKTAVQNMLGKNDEMIIKLKLNEQTENEDR